MLIELLAVIALQHRQDAIGREGFLVDALRPHRIVDVRDSAQHRGEVQRRRELTPNGYPVPSRRR